MWNEDRFVCARARYSGPGRSPVDLGSQGLKNTAYITVLQGKPKLYAQETETHSPYLPETEFRFHFDFFTHITLVMLFKLIYIKNT